MSDIDRSVEESVTIEQASRWLAAWAADQAYIASRQKPGSIQETRFATRAEALADAARDLLSSDIWDLGGFVREDGTYPERKEIPDV